MSERLSCSKARKRMKMILFFENNLISKEILSEATELG